MKLSPNPPATWELIKQIQENMSGDDRLPGTHVSDLLYCLRKTWARMIGLPIPPHGDVTTLLFMRGRALHGRMELVEGETLLDVDGIHGSIDRVEHEDGFPPLPCEIKSTDASASSDPFTKSPQYFDQLGAYCYMMGVNKGRMYILYNNGAYLNRGSKKVAPELAEKLLSFGYDYYDRPMLLAYDVEFEREELEAHWKELLRRKELLDRSLAQVDVEVDALTHYFGRPMSVADLTEGHLLATAPPLSEHWTWECERCSVRELIDCPGGVGKYEGNFSRASSPMRFTERSFDAA